MAQSYLTPFDQLCSKSNFQQADITPPPLMFSRLTQLKPDDINKDSLAWEHVVSAFSSKDERMIFRDYLNTSPFIALLLTHAYSTSLHSPDIFRGDLFSIINCVVTYCRTLNVYPAYMTVDQLLGLNNTVRWLLRMYKTVAVTVENVRLVECPFQYLLQSDTEHEFHIRVNKKKAKVQRRRGVCQLLPTSMLQQTTRRIGDEDIREFSGPIFEGFEYQGVELNAGLTCFVWEHLAQIMNALEKFGFKITSSTSFHEEAEFKRQFKLCSNLSTYCMNDFQANQVRALLIYVYARTTDFCKRVTPSYLVDIDNYSFIDNPAMRMPVVPKWCFEHIVRNSRHVGGCEIREPVFSMGWEENYYLLALMKACPTSYVLDIRKINAIIRSALNTQQDPVQILMSRCYIWKENGPIDVDSGWPCSYKDSKRMGWCLNFIPPVMFKYSVNIKLYSKFFMWFRTALVSLRASIITYVKQVVEIMNLPNHLRTQYKSNLKKSFIALMQTPSAQLMFSAGDSHQDVTDAIYHSNIVALRKAALKADEVGHRTMVLKRIRIRTRLTQRDEKRSMQDYDCGDVQVQSNSSDTCPNPQPYGIFPQSDVEWEDQPTQSTVSWFANSIMTYVVATITTTLITTAMWYVWKQVKECLPMLREAGMLRMFTKPVKTMLEIVHQTVYETSMFLLDSKAKMSPLLEKRLIQAVAGVNIIYDCVKGRYTDAARHIPYLAITNAQLIKDFLATLMQPNNDPGPVREGTYRWNWQGVNHILNVSQYDQLMRMAVIHATPEQYTLFATSLGTHVQALGPGTNLLKPLFKMAAQVSAGYMGEQEIRDANNMYQYMNHTGTFACEQAELAQNVISMICTALFGWDPFNATWQGFATDIYSMIDFVERVHLLRDTFPADKPLQLQVVEKWKMSNELRKDPRMALMPAWLSQYFTARVYMLDAMGKLCQSYIKGFIERPTPVCILFLGPPNVGKTTSMQYMYKALCGVMGKPYGPENVYVYNPDNEFHEGYAHQQFTQFNDMFKEKDVMKRAKEAVNIMNMVDTAPYNMPMAFENKGQVFFDSPFIFCTTNEGQQGLKTVKWEVGLTEPAAMQRRFHIIVHRDEVYSPDGPHANVFKIEQCTEFPELVGKSLTPPLLAKLMLRIRKKFHERTVKMTTTMAEVERHMGGFDNVYNVIRLPDDPIRGDEAPPQPVVEEEQIQVQAEPDCEFNLGGDDEPSYIAIDQIQLTKDERQIYYNIWRANNPNVPISMLNMLKDEDLVDAIPQDEFEAEYKKFHMIPDAEPAPKFERYFPEKILTPTEWCTKFLTWKFNDQDPDDVAVLAKIRFYALLFGALTAVSSAAIFYAYWSSVEPQSFSKKARRSIRNQQRFKDVKQKIIEKIRIKPQSNEDNTFMCLRNSLSKACVHVVATAFDAKNEPIKGSGNQALGFHYDNGWFFMPHHFASKYRRYQDADVRICIHWQGGKHVMDLPDFHTVQGEDIMFFQVKGLPNKPKALKKHIWTSEDVGDINFGTPMQLISVLPNGQMNAKNVHRAHEAGLIEYYHEGFKYALDYSHSYYEETVCGDSGAILVLPCRQGAVKVIGFHICMKSSKTARSFGFSLPIARDVIDQYIQQVTETTVVQSNPFLMPAIPFEPLRLVPTIEAHVPPHISKLYKSCMYQWNGPSLYKPAHLTPFVNAQGETISPLLKAFKKLRTVHIEPTEVPSTTIAYLLHVYPRPDEPPQLHTFQQALRGIDGTNVISINAGTSAGYPFSLQRKRGKSAFIKLIGNTYEFEPTFLTNLEYIDEQLRSGELMTVIFSDILKDETRPNAKVDEGKTRLFSACPIDYLFLVRRYFGAFVSYVKSLAHTHPICVGLDVHSINWERIYMQLKTKALSIIAGDFENWDGNIPQFVADVAVEFINQWYDDGAVNAIVRRELCRHMTNAVHICYTTVYQTRGSSPTGNPITSEWNSLIQLICIYIVMKLDLKLRDDQYVPKLYGDDNLIGVEKVGLRCSDLAPHFKRRFQMTYTHWTKSDNHDHDTLETVSFIGRSFRRCPLGYMRAPLELSVILEMWNYIKGAESEEFELLSIADSFFSELSHLPEDMFDRWSEKCLKEITKRVPDIADAVRAKKLSYDCYTMRRYQQEYSYPEYQIQSKDVKLTVANFAENNEGETDRFIQEPGNTQHVEMGAIKDVAPITTTTTNTQEIQDPQKNINMETFNFDKSLDRVFQIASPITWSTTQASGTVLASLSFPQLLFNQTYIADKINDFRAFIAGVQVDIRIGSARTLYGKLMLVYIPYQTYYPIAGTLQTFPIPTNIYQLSGHPHTLADASSSDVVSMEVPFVSAQRYLDLYKYGNSEMGRFQLVVLDPLTNSENAVSTANIFVTAGFKNAKVFLPTDTSAGALALRFKEKPDSSDEVRRLGLESAEKVDPEIMDDLDKYIVQSSASDIFQPGATKFTKVKNLEAVKKLNAPVSSKEVTSPTKGMMGVATLMAKTAGNLLYDVASNVGTVAAIGMLGLSKPTTVNTTAVVTNNPHFHVNAGKGIDCSMKTALDNENAISTMPDVGGVTADEMSIAYIACTPSMVTRTAWVPGSTPIQLAATDIDTNMAFVDHLKMAHCMWSGSHKFKMYITASLYHSVRFVFYLAINTASDWQVCYHQVVEVQGSTEVALLVPYCCSTPMRAYYDTTVQYGLFCQILSWSQADSSIICPIYISTYKAGTSDFKVGAPRDFTYTVQSCPRVDFNADFEPIQDSITGFTHDGLVCGENIDTIRLHVHRMHAYTPVGATATTTLLIRTDKTAGVALVGVDYWSAFYRFWRGSIRYKMVYPKGAVNFCTLIMKNNYSNAYFQGCAMGNPMSNSTDGELPFYSPVLFDMCNSPAIDSRSIYKSATTQAGYLFKAGGDDFSFHWLTLPAPGVYQNTGASFVGYYGFATSTG